MIKKIKDFLNSIESKIDDRKLFAQVNKKITLLRTMILFIILCLSVSLIYLVK